MKAAKYSKALYAALASASFYFIQLGLESRGLDSSWALPLALLISSVLIGVGLPHLVSKVPIKYIPIVRDQFPIHKAEGFWLETQFREENGKPLRYYSIVHLYQDSSAKGMPYKMKGDTYSPSGEKESTWCTTFICDNCYSDGVSTIYIYEKTRINTDDDPEEGYGKSHFWGTTGKPEKLIEGQGRYLSWEQRPLALTTFKLQRIDDQLKAKIGWTYDKLDNDEFNKIFISLVEDHNTKYHPPLEFQKKHTNHG